MVKPKRIGPGQYELSDNRILTEKGRSVPHNLSVTTTITAGFEVGGDLEAVRLQDSQAAIEALAHGDMSHLRERLAAQAISADQMFFKLIQNASVAMSPGMPNGAAMADLYLRHASRMGEFSRKALVSLAEIRNPKRSATFVKQQNNLMVASSGEPASTPTLGASQHGGMDFEATKGPAGKIVEAQAVEAIDRAEE
jgi:hypothetical protein